MIAVGKTPIEPIDVSEERKPSKTRRKQEVHALQALGEALVELGDAQLEAIEMPERLRDAVMEARGITRHEARRRQMQYIGKLMRNADPEPIRSALEALQASSRGQTALHKRAEAWRERLLADPDAVGALRLEFPGADPFLIQSLVRDALLARSAGQPPRAYRALYQELRALIERG